MIEVRNVFKSFGDQRVLTDVSARFEPGKTTLIMGISGSGKTVLMKCMVGLLEVDQGQIMYDDIDFTQLNNGQRKEIRKKIGMLFQGSALFDSMTVEENVLLPLDMFTNWTRKEKLDRVNFCLERVNLNGANRKYPDEVSGGMKKGSVLPAQ